MLGGCRTELQQRSIRFAASSNSRHSEGRTAKENEDQVDKLGAGLAELNNKTQEQETEGWRPENTEDIHHLDRAGGKSERPPNRCRQPFISQAGVTGLPTIR